jgi:MarR family transcriptional regulator, organic hydroperoxide resistance regulator
MVANRLGAQVDRQVDGQLDGDVAREAWHLITSLLMQRKEQFPAIAAAYGLNPGSLHALLSLDADQPQAMRSLAESWKCDASNVTWLVDRLEERGLAERRAHATDRRIRTVVLTRKGVKVRAEIEAILFEPPEAIRALSSDDLETLCAILAKVAPSPAADA